MDLTNLIIQWYLIHLGNSVTHILHAAIMIFIKRGVEKIILLERQLDYVSNLINNCNVSVYFIFLTRKDLVCFIVDKGLKSWTVQSDFFGKYCSRQLMKCCLEVAMVHCVM